jgi:hypothetical protein
VISNRDTKTLQILDLWLDFVDTSKVVPRFEQQAREYSVTRLDNIKWDDEPDHIISAVRDKNLESLKQLHSPKLLKSLLEWLLEKNEHTRVVEIYDYFTSAIGPQVQTQSGKDFVRCLLQFLLQAPFATKKFFHSEIWKVYAETLKEEVFSIAPRLLCMLVLSGNSLGSFVIEPFGIVLSQMKELRYQQLSELIELVTLTIRSADLALDLLLEQLDPHLSKILASNPKSIHRYTRQLYGAALDHIGEAAESTVVREDLVELEYKHVTNGFSVVEARIRLDAPSTSSLRTGDHVRLHVASTPQNAPGQPLLSIDSVVEASRLGSATFRCLQRLPEYFEKCSWKIQHCGSFVSTGEMLNALTSFYAEKESCCRIFDVLTNSNAHAGASATADLKLAPESDLNESQNRALAAAMSTKVTLLWGPPGTGKTRTVVEILQQLLKAAPTKRIMVAAPTHNAVDNVLRKFVELGGISRTNTNPIRVSTDVCFHRIIGTVIVDPSDFRYGKFQKT